MDDLVGLLDGDTLVLAQRRVLVGELIAQLAGPRVDHRRLVEIDTEFGCAARRKAAAAVRAEAQEIAADENDRAEEKQVVHDMETLRAG